jgi:stage IV sporulation protein FB
MKWSFRLGRWFGIQVRVHVTFALLVALLLSGAVTGDESWGYALRQTLLAFAVFGFVVLHEYGHALTARHYGIRTHAITLYPMGGVAMLEGMPEDPRQELRIALAGPAVNFVLAAGLWGGAHLLLGGPGPFVDCLIYVNLVMGTFNLVPALPMDGGRVLRAALAMRMPQQRATQLATRLARVLAAGMAVLGVLWPGHGMLVLIALFVWAASAAELRASEHREALRVHTAQVFHARQVAADAPGMHVVYGPDGRRLFVGEL